MADPDHHREAITSRPLLLHGIARQTHHAGQTRLTVTSNHGRRGAVVAALRRITGFFQTLVRSAEQLSAEDRWRRILAEALKKYPPWPPAGASALAPTASGRAGGLKSTPRNGRPTPATAES